MIRVNIIVEGQSEEGFVRDVLAPYLGTRSVFVVARSVETSRRRRRIYRGGLLNDAKAKRDIQRWLSQDTAALVTTMFDLYALPTDFPGRALSTSISRLEEEFSNDIANRRFVPYIQRHEFEALLFSDVAILDSEFVQEASRLERLQTVRKQAATPEDIDDVAPPSKRLLELYPSYEKIVHGPLITSRIGIERIRAQCPHFSEWLNTLESRVSN